MGDVVLGGYGVEGSERGAQEVVDRFLELVIKDVTMHTKIPWHE